MPSSRKTAPKSPDDAALKKLLGRSFSFWTTIQKHLDELEGLTREWKFYGEKYGWQLKVSAKKRALLYLIPREGRLTAAIALNDAALARARESDIPTTVIREIEGAKKLPEGRPFRTELTSADDCALVMRLVELKAAQ